MRPTRREHRCTSPEWSFFKKKQISPEDSSKSPRERKYKNEISSIETIFKKIEEQRTSIIFTDGEIKSKVDEGIQILVKNINESLLEIQNLKQKSIDNFDPEEEIEIQKIIKLYQEAKRIMRVESSPELVNLKQKFGLR